jgi:hypothetical protein
VQIARLKPSEKLSDAFSCSGAPTHDQSSNKKLVNEVDDGSNAILPKANDLSVKLVDVKLVSKNQSDLLVFQRVGLGVAIKGEGKPSSDDKGSK